MGPDTESGADLRDPHASSLGALRVEPLVSAAHFLFVPAAAGAKKMCPEAARVNGSRGIGLR